jgi:hypothetical protein
MLTQQDNNQAEKPALVELAEDSRHFQVSVLHQEVVEEHRQQISDYHHRHQQAVQLADQVEHQEAEHLHQRQQLLQNNPITA